jgi:hypothetical protein
LRLCKSFRVLAYVFWHTPGAIDGIVTYEAAWAAFHRSLDPADISGFRGSQAFLVRGAMCVSSSVCVMGAQVPHDDVAGHALAR